MAAIRIEDPVERRRFCEDACGGDLELRAQVEELLGANDGMGAAEEWPPGALAEVGEPSSRIGRYKLLQKIGEGGGGVVYMAEQEEPVRRRVALKILKLGMDTRAVVARFEAERQALAMMDHPHIARVFDAGATETGRPYFVMELVRGVPITEYCDRNGLTTELRLRLFSRVCSAIQHAHQKGIIHRDIKPSNILITLHDGTPVPKVIDFGIAKAIEHRLTEKTLFTRFEQFIGTPAYMSPEQAEMSGMDVDTRSDIYSLGVLLYELLTGRTPFDPRALLDGGIDAMRRTIREVEPVKPSAKVATLQDAELTTTAKRRSSEVPRLVRSLQGDLDWIVMRCLEKDRTRRYETANGLAMDIGRYLAREPVTARPPSTGYRFRKWADRNRALFASVSAVAAALLLGLGLSLWMYFQARFALKRAVAAEQAEKELRSVAEANEQTARVAATRSDQIARFLSEMLSGVGPAVAQGRDTALLREILDRSSERVGQDLKDNPEVEAFLRQMIGSVQTDLGEYHGAETNFRRLIELQRQLHGTEHREVAAAIMELGGVFDRRGSEWQKAEIQYREALDMRRRLLGSDHPEVLDSLQALAAMLNTQEKWEAGEQACREALALARKIHGPRDSRVIRLLDFLRWNLQGQGRLLDAEHVMREALNLVRETAGAESMPYGNGLGTLCELLRQQKRITEAQPLLDEYLGICRRNVPKADLADAAYFSNFAWVLRQFGRLKDAETIYRASMETWRRLAGPHYHRVAHEAANLASVLIQLERWDEAESFARTAVEVRRANRKDDPAKLPHDARQLVELLIRHPEGLREAEQLLVDELAAARALQPPNPEVIEDLAKTLGSLLRRSGRMEEAERVLRENGTVVESSKH